MSDFETRRFGDVVCVRGDCLSVMPTLKPASVNFIFADLPYACTRNHWDTAIDLQKFWKSARHLEDDKCVYSFTSTQKFACALICSNPGLFKYDIIWEKTASSGFLNAKKMPLRSHESVLIFYKKAGTYNPQFTLGAPYKYTHITESLNYGKMNGARGQSDGRRHPKSVLKIPNTNRGVHPTQKPVALLEWLIATYTNPGDLILDPTAGSGTTGCAAINLGRRAILIEKDPTYFGVMCKRIAEHQQKAETAPHCGVTTDKTTFMN